MSYLDKIAEMKPMSRMYFEEPHENSTDTPSFGPGGIFLGYPEKDEHFRKRILKELNRV